MKDPMDIEAGDRVMMTMRQGEGDNITRRRIEGILTVEAFVYGKRTKSEYPCVLLSNGLEWFANNLIILEPSEDELALHVYKELHGKEKYEDG